MAKKDDELNVEQEEKKEKKPKKEKSKKEGKEEKSDNEEGAAGKIVSALIVIVIVLIWLGVFIVLVKADVGGFGSKVLAPVLQDVPVINKILPEGSTDQSNDYDYTLDEAIDRIKELEMELDSQSSTNGVDSSYIAQLEAEIERLQEFEKQQDEFAKQKKEFDENVVYADNAPDISEYQKYYEQMDPDNAAEIYRQVVEEEQYNEKVENAAKRYAEMEPASAANILAEMTSADLDMVCSILDSMDSEQSGLILQAMDSNVAAKITKRMLAKE